MPDLRAMSRLSTTLTAAALSIALAGCGATGAVSGASGESGGETGGGGAARTDAPTSAASTPTRADSAEPTASTGSDEPVQPVQPVAGAALAEATTLLVRGRAPMTGYERDLFGSGWIDTDRNGCDTRNDMLRAQLSDLMIRAGTHDCLVESGVLADPYTATTIDFVRGDGTAVDIDHVVALGNGWVSGAYDWTPARRIAFANDPLNLLAVDAGANRQKGDGDAATWLPSNRPYRCAYVARQVAVKAKYDLSVAPAEFDAIERILTACPTEPLPPDSGHATESSVGVPD